MLGEGLFFSVSSKFDRLVVISSPSGGGKGTLIKKLLENNDDIWLSVSATTRSPRDGEKDGVSYFFMDRERFVSQIEDGEFLEFAEYSGNFYGTPKKYIQEHLDAGEIVLLEIEVVGATKVAEKCPGCKSVFIKPPSLEVLEQRLRGRGTESEEQITSRLECAKRELEEAKNYDMIIVNDDLDVAFRELNDYINSLR